jgi:adenine-specific DNA-methyltransferase
VAGKIDLIYIDPHFAVNRVYQSNRGYTDLLQGACYLEFILEMIIVMRELLSNTVSIYVHLDGNMAFEVKFIMDEIFGKKMSELNNPEEVQLQEHNKQK